MAGFGSSTKDESDRFSLDLPTNNTQATDWGSGLAAEVGTGLATRGGLAETATGITQDLARGPSFGQTGAGRTFGDWGAGALGASYGGDLSTGAFDWTGGGGLGVGVGGGDFTQQFSDQVSGWERTAQGYAAGMTGMGHFDGFLDTAYGQGHLGGNIYTGFGTNGYGFSDVDATGATTQGFGGDLTHTPVGVSDLSFGARGNSGNGFDASAGSVQVGTVGAHGEGYTTSDGTVGARGGLDMGRTTAEDLAFSADSALGSTDVEVGSIAQGRFHQGQVEVGPDGSVNGEYSRGGHLTVTDVAATHDGALGTTEAQLGRYGAMGPTRYTGGYDATENRLTAGVADGSGWAIQDASLTHAYGDVEASASAGRFESGTAYEGSGYIDLDDGSGHVEGSGRFGGVEGTDLAASVGGENGQLDVGVDRVSTMTEVTGASVDIADGQLDARLEQLRTGGPRISGADAHLEVGDATADLSAGELSSDLIVDNAYLTANGDGISAGADRIDGGGIRGENLAANVAIGDDFTADAGVGSFATSNSASDVHFTADGDGANLSVGEFAVAGRDVTDAHLNIDGPGGSHLDASLGAYHSGLTGSGIDAGFDGNGATLSAEQLAYDGHQIRDASVSTGVDGVVGVDASVGEAHMSQARVSGLDAAVDENGARIALDSASYSHLGASDVRADVDLFDGAAGADASIGEISYAGGSVGRTEITSNPLDGTSSLTAEDINAHYLTASDVEANANIGDVNATVGAAELAIGDADIGSLTAESSNYGLTQSAAATDVDVGLVRADDLTAGIGYGDQRLLDVTTDIDASVGAERIEGAFDATQGTASGAIEDGRVTAMLDDTTVGIGGYDIDIGRTGVDANVNAAGEVDLFNGTASGEASLAGTEVSLFGYDATVGDWAQASAGVDVSEGAANFNLGGENGVGADVNLSEGNLDLNVAGYEIDVDQGIRDAGSAIADGAGYVADSVGEFFSGW